MESTGNSRLSAKFSIRPLKMPQKTKSESRRDDGVELETQVILRMPEEPSRILRDILREGGNNLKDRLTVKLENDLRYGEVRFDHWLLHAKLVDLPTVTESLKTIDNKSFYKTADICQMIICKEEPDLPTTDDESPTKNKKKDPNKVDKKFLWPHGITPPCKNIRKRRFRKTLKKKYVEAPEIEKEVKRLLRADNEAVNVKWEIVKDEDEQKNQMLNNDESTSQSMSMTPMSMSEKSSKKNKSGGKSHGESGRGSSEIPRDIDIFGEDLSSSDSDDNGNINVDVDETSRLTADDQSDYSNSMHGQSSMMTEFNKQMFHSPRSRLDSSNLEPPHTPVQMRGSYDESRADSEDEEIQHEVINEKIAKLRREMNELHNQRIQKEQEISTIENQTLRLRMQDSLENILGQLLNKEMEIQMYESMMETDN